MDVVVSDKGRLFFRLQRMGRIAANQRELNGGMGRPGMVDELEGWEEGGVCDRL